MSIGGQILKLARAQGKVGRIDSEIEAIFMQQMKAAKAPAWERNFEGAIAGRKFELDWAWPQIRFAVEVEGEVHRIKERFHKDIEKHWLLLEAGWTCLRVDGRVIRSGQALVWTLAMLKRYQPRKPPNQES